MEGIKIVLGSILAAITYGVLQDQITARVCVEYFTIGHVDLFGTNSPTLLAFGWGVVATWWAGLMLGIPLAVAARAGSRPKLTLADLVRPITRLLVCMGVIAAVAGVVGYFAALNGSFQLEPYFATLIPADRHARFLADAAAHEAAYASGFSGGLAVCVWAWRQRGILARQMATNHQIDRSAL